MVEVVQGDMLRPETLGPALQSVERALMISSPNSEMHETQCRFIDACKKAGVQHIVKFSGFESGVDPKKFRFMRMHNEIEHYLENSGAGNAVSADSENTWNAGIARNRT
jgi:uncharacterized protein YbjT (DUF2867 family)